MREIVAAFEQNTGKEVELVQIAQPEGHDRVEEALEAGRPPDFFRSIAQWAFEDRLADLHDVIGSRLDLFDADAIAAATLLDGRTGWRGLYALPLGRQSNHIHVWRGGRSQATQNQPPALAFGDAPEQGRAARLTWPRSGIREAEP